MSKINIDKFVVSLIEFSPQQSMKYIKALADQGLKYKDGEIVSIDSDSEKGEQPSEEEMVGMGELGKVWNEQAIISRLDKIIELLQSAMLVLPQETYIPPIICKRPLDPDPNTLGGWETTASAEGGEE